MWLQCLVDNPPLLPANQATIKDTEEGQAVSFWSVGNPSWAVCSTL